MFNRSALAFSIARQDNTTRVLLTHIYESVLSCVNAWFKCIKGSNTCHGKEDGSRSESHCGGDKLSKQFHSF